MVNMKSIIFFTFAVLALVYVYAVKPDACQNIGVEYVQDMEIPDPYRWLEDGTDPRVQAWTDAQNQKTRDYLAHFSEQTDALKERLNALTRYEETTFEEALIGNKRFVWSRHAHDEQWRFGY